MTQTFFPAFGETDDSRNDALAHVDQPGIYEGMVATVAPKPAGGWTLTLAPGSRGISIWRHPGTPTDGGVVVRETASITLDIAPAEAQSRTDVVVGAWAWSAGTTSQSTGAPTGEITAAMAAVYGIQKGAPASLPVVPALPTPWDAQGRNPLPLLMVQVPDYLNADLLPTVLQIPGAPSAGVDYGIPVGAVIRGYMQDAGPAYTQITGDTIFARAAFPELSAIQPSRDYLGSVSELDSWASVPGPLLSSSTGLWEGFHLTTGFWLKACCATSDWVHWSHRPLTNGEYAIAGAGNALWRQQPSLSVSTDLGATWTLMSSRPTFPLTGLYGTCYGNGRHYAAGAGGNTWAHSADLITWTAVGSWSYGSPKAMAAGAGLVVVATQGFGLIVSADHGATWTDKSAVMPGSQAEKVACNGSAFIAVAPPGTVGGPRTSTDGITWTARTVGTPTEQFAQVAGANGVFLALHYLTGQLWRSADNGATWADTGLRTDVLQTAHVLTSNGSQFSFCGYGCRRVSADGLTWTKVFSAPTSGAKPVVFKGKAYLPGADASQSGAAGLYSTSDLSTWTYQPSAIPAALTAGDVAMCKALPSAGLLLLTRASEPGRIHIFDGTTWTTSTAAWASGAQQYVVDACHTGPTFALLFKDGTVATTSDWSAWTPRGLGAGNTLAAITSWGAEAHGITADGSYLLYSLDSGISWTKVATGVSGAAAVDIVTFKGRIFAAAHFATNNRALVLSSANGRAWGASIDLNNCYYRLVHGRDHLILPFTQGRVDFTRDGVSWASKSTWTSSPAVVYLRGRYWGFSLPGTVPGGGAQANALSYTPETHLMIQASPATVGQPNTFVKHRSR